MSPVPHDIAALIISVLSILVSMLLGMVLSLVVYFAKGHAERLMALEERVQRCEVSHAAAHERDSANSARISDVVDRIESVERKIEKHFESMSAWMQSISLRIGRKDGGE